MRSPYECICTLPEVQRDPVGSFQRDPVGSFQRDPGGSFQRDPVGSFQRDPVGSFQQFEFVWDSQDPATVLDNFGEMSSAFRLKCRKEDEDRLLVNVHHPAYYQTYLFGSTAFYLRSHLPFYIKSCILQIRLNFPKLFYRGIAVDVTVEQCKLCSQSSVMMLEHLMLFCPVLDSKRQTCGTLSKCNTYNQLMAALNTYNEQDIKEVFYYFINLVKSLQ